MRNNDYSQNTTMDHSAAPPLPYKPQGCNSTVMLTLKCGAPAHATSPREMLWLLETITRPFCRTQKKSQQPGRYMRRCHVMHRHAKTRQSLQYPKRLDVLHAVRFDAHCVSFIGIYRVSAEPSNPAQLPQLASQPSTAVTKSGSGTAVVLRLVSAAP